MPTIPPPLHPLLNRTPSDARPIVVMTCGIAGAGKSTLSKLITATYPSFVRVSIDNIIYEKHGLYGVDYAREKYAGFLEEADGMYYERFLELLSGTEGEKGEEKKKKRCDVVLDRSFYAKQDRDEFKKVIERNGARWVLVYLKAADKEVLRRRIRERKEGKREADSAFDVTDEILDRYWKGFEEPVGEGEIVVEVL